MAFFETVNSVVGTDLNEKLTVDKRLEGDDGVNHAGMWGKNTAGGDTCTCKGAAASGELWILHRVSWGSTRFE